MKLKIEQKTTKRSSSAKRGIDFGQTRSISSGSENEILLPVFALAGGPISDSSECYLSYRFLFAFGQFRNFFIKIFDWWHASSLQGYVPICLGLEDFYIRQLYLRIQDCFGPICIEK